MLGSTPMADLGSPKTTSVAHKLFASLGVAVHDQGFLEYPSCPVIVEKEVEAGVSQETLCDSALPCPPAGCVCLCLMIV